MATVAEIIGTDWPAEADKGNYNILPDFRWKKPIREAIGHHPINGISAARRGKWKIIQGVGSGGCTKSEKPELEIESQL